MKIYLVGGAIRDRLLKFSVRDRDWVVVGSTPREMLDNKYQQVGRDFPVFIHPKTHEEYALARTEKKHGLGYTGFLFNFSAKITLKEDLIRRDLTINAMAQDKLGNIIDFFNGQKDIKNRVLRHVSPAFQEDPLRVLRVARFAASLSHLGFYIAKKTLCLMQQISSRKELLYLTPERVWKETNKALCTRNPHIYFRVLYCCDALVYLFPEINFFFIRSSLLYYNINNFSVLQFSFMELSRISKITSDIDTRLSYFLQFVSHIYFFPIYRCENHFFYEPPVLLLKNFFQRFKIPKETQKISIFLCGFHNFLQTITVQSSKLIVDFFNVIDVWRKPNRLNQLIYLNFYCVNDFKKNQYTNSLGRLLKSMFFVIKDISVRSFLNKKKFKGIEIKNELYRLRVRSLENWRNKKLNII